VAEKVGLTVEELEKLVKPFEAIYTIADHSRCLAFMFGDGIVPSNVREGYLARLVLRRTLKFMREIGLEIPLSEIVKIHIDDIGNDFPELKENERYILEIVGIEEKRYRETLARGRRLVEKTSDYLARENKTEMPVDMLVDLYDTHGLPPEIVKEVAESQGIKVTIPDDFYIKVGTRHAETRLETLIEPKKFEGKIKALPETKLLFYDSPYLIEFSAKVLDVFDGKFVVLDQTCFYPEGGGQPSDKGTLDGNEVVDVQKVGEIVVHEIKGKLNKGDIVQGKIDWDGRLALMRHHTSTHLLLGAARRVLGDHVWQHGAQKGIDRSRLDISHFEQIKPEDLKKIEQLANSVIMANKPVKIEWMDRNEAEKKYGFRLYQGGVVSGKKIRVVRVEEWDVEACAGTHCLKTGEIGPFKIIRTERIQDGVERIEFVSGEAAIKYFQQRDDLLQKIADVFRVAPEKALFAAERFFDEWKKMRKEVERLREQVAELRIYNLVSKARQLKGIKLIVETIPEADMDELIRTGATLTKHDPSIVAILFSKRDGVKICGLAGETALKSGASVQEAVIMAAEIVGGKGGGRADMAQGGGPRVEKLNEAIQSTIKYFREKQ
ncbi:MAG: alanine--tRNA ligase, partial [Euryarchaeota archaeon]|nr:alanine--tRNA ligase [Euryarchaeota archaeon]